MLSFKPTKHPILAGVLDLSLSVAGVFLVAGITAIETTRRKWTSVMSPTTQKK